MRKPTIKHRYPKKSKIRISISRLICHLLPVPGLRAKAAFLSIRFVVSSNPEKIPDKKSLRSVRCDTSGGNPLAKRKLHTRELPGRPRLNISFQNYASLQVQNINAPARKRQVFYFLPLPRPKPWTRPTFDKEIQNLFEGESKNLINYPTESISSEIRFLRKDAASLIATNCVSPVFLDFNSIFPSLSPFGPTTTL